MRTPVAAWSDLASRGVVVVPSFLDAPEIDLLQRRGATAEIPAHMLEVLRPKLDVVAIEAREHGVDTDTVVAAPTSGAEWHQSFFFFQSGHYLRFWIPIEQHSSVAFLPMDTLIARAPRIRDVVLGGGASRLVIANGRTELYNDDLGSRATLDFDVDEIAVAPTLSPGDLVLLRGDVFHRTQTTGGAVTFVMTDANAVVRKRRLLEGSRHKHHTLLRNPLQYAKLLTYFNKYNRREVRAKELLAYMNSGHAPRAAMAIALAELLVNWRELPTRSIA